MEKNKYYILDPFKPDATKSDIVLKDSFLVKEKEELVGFAVEAGNGYNHLVFIRVGSYNGKDGLEEAIRKQFFLIEALKANPNLAEQVKKEADLIRKTKTIQKVAVIRGFGVQAKEDTGAFFCPKCEQYAIEYADNEMKNLMSTFDNKFLDGTECFHCGALWLFNKKVWESELAGWLPKVKKSNWIENQNKKHLPDINHKQIEYK